MFTSHNGVFNCTCQRVATGSFCADDTEQRTADILAAVGKGTIFSKIMSLRDGRIIRLVNHPMQGGGWVATHEDITEEKRAEEQVVYVAHPDELTGLPNRKVFCEQLEHHDPPPVPLKHLTCVFGTGCRPFKALKEKLISETRSTDKSENQIIEDSGLAIAVYVLYFAGYGVGGASEYGDDKPLHSNGCWSTGEVGEHHLDQGSCRNDGIITSRVEASSIAASKKKDKINAQKRYREAKGSEEESNGQEKASLAE